MTGLEHRGAQRGDAPLPGAWGGPPQHDGRVGGKSYARQKIELCNGPSAGETPSVIPAQAETQKSPSPSAGEN